MNTTPRSSPRLAASRKPEAGLSHQVKPTWPDSRWPIWLFMRSSLEIWSMPVTSTAPIGSPCSPYAKRRNRAVAPAAHGECDPEVEAGRALVELAVAQDVEDLVGEARVGLAEQDTGLAQDRDGGNQRAVGRALAAQRPPGE